MKYVAIQGSTGSIGISTLQVIEQNSERFCVFSLMAGENVSLLASQIRTFRPRVVSVKGESQAANLRHHLGADSPEILWGDEGLKVASASEEVDIVVAGASGIICLEAVLAALKKGKRVALANKELLVVGGEILMVEAKESGAEVIPVDSEHSAIFQAMSGHGREFVSRLILSASGGPFFFDREKDLSTVTVQEAVNHPVWQMGAKISVDSATVMNKGYEIIEAMHLFGIPPEKIEVIIHPQGMVHSMVEFTDGTILAQIGIPDMKVPIGYGLAYPERLTHTHSFDLEEVMSGLTFLRPDLNRFPSLALAMEVAKKGGMLPAVMSTANDTAVASFVAGDIKFTEIYEVCAEVVGSFERRAATGPGDSVPKLFETIALARDLTDKIIDEKKRGL